ncbi:MAG: hypothetical protein WKF37_01180 [Bryobacteraceae bacterium]
MQLNIDLGATKPRRPHGGDCECKQAHGDMPVVSPKGYVLFHASAGDGLSVTVAGEDQKVVFDSSRLQEGDLFATTLLEPGVYRMENRMGGAKGEIIVTLTPEDAKRIKSLEAQYVDVAGGFNPAKVELVSSQGLVFRR